MVNIQKQFLRASYDDECMVFIWLEIVLNFDPKLIAQVNSAHGHTNITHKKSSPGLGSRMQDMLKVTMDLISW